MTNSAKTILALIVAAVVVVIVVLVAKPATPGTNTPAPGGMETPSASLFYACNDNKTVEAEIFDTHAKVGLSDGRNLDLAKKTTTDGDRYANADESIVFWRKTNGALILENNQEKSFIGCVLVKANPGDVDEVYQNGTEGLSMRYPTGFTLDKNYTYQALGPGKSIAGAKFTIPASLTSGTNLSDDSYISIESLPNTSNCNANLFLEDGTPAATTVTDAGVTYSKATATGAAAGNRYEETVFAVPGTNPCIAVRYFIHYGVIENYPAGTVQEFDKQALLDTFDKIRRTLVINQ